jgi:hypothetical protein
MRSPADRPQTSPLALPPVTHARGSSCPQCGRAAGSNCGIVSWRTVVLYRRPQCGQQLQPSPRLRFVRVFGPFKIEIHRSAITTRSQVPNRPRNRGRSNPGNQNRFLLSPGQPRRRRYETQPRVAAQRLPWEPEPIPPPTPKGLRRPRVRGRLSRRDATPSGLKTARAIRPRVAAKTCGNPGL